MGLKIIETYDGQFSLSPEAKQALFELLISEAFLQRLAWASQAEQVEFTGLLFQPVPYSTDTPKGMPAEFEKFHDSADHTIVNVPPHFMFQAKIFKPSRLCAVYRHV
ncbi:hypothetical protein IQ266_09805 [filamentous cyanobacterium LEGE 11480]|uniref:Uncharacterized protein n=1 Tax=Romeriopsis navalis LEGE 11480 TaxID=2777977 RepID=A0A928VK24_9CYAN|nr:hypothetical protein [Romeriopsis navalis]MBE9030021.1 hypothetical protein [Romeriopsis navalis LEGE 11480]